MSNRATIVHVITQLELGGAQQNTLDTCAGLDRSRFRVVLACGPGGLLDAEAREIPGLEFVPIPSLVRPIDPVKDAQALQQLRALLRAQRRHGPVLVHTHSSKAGILARAAAASLGIRPTVHSIHGFGFTPNQPPAKRRLLVWAEKVAGPWTDAFISVSETNLAEARARGIIGGSQRGIVVRSGFDLEPFRNPERNATQMRSALDIPEGGKLILSPANMKHQKDPLTMIRAMAILRREHPNTYLVIAGDGELRPQVEALIEELGLGDHVRLLGWRRDIPELIGAADVIALSSIFEGLPRVAVQAVVAGKPFVGTRVDGTPEVIRDGKNGFLVEPCDPDALARALGRGLVEAPTDPTDEARTRAWALDTMVRAQAQLYDELLAN